MSVIRDARCALAESTKARPRSSPRGLAPPHQMPARGHLRRRRGRRRATRRSETCTPDVRGTLKSRACPRSSPPGIPRRQVPAREHPRRRRFSRLCLGVGALRQRDEDVEGGALDAVRHAHQCGLDDLRRRGAPPRPRRPTIREPPPRSWVGYVSVTKATMPSRVAAGRAHRNGSRRHVDALRRRRGARARTRRGDGLGPRDEFVYADARDGLCRTAPTAP